MLGGCVKHGGLPIANVELILTRAANRFAGTQAAELESMFTARSGEYRFTVEAGEYFLQVKPDQSTRFIPFRTESIFVNGNTKLDVLLELGRVWSGKFKSASAQADEYKYELVLWRGNGAPASVRTLKLGESFELVLERGPYKATIVRRNDNDSGITIWAQNLSAQGDTRQDIVLPDLFKLSGKVFNQEDLPLNHASVTILRVEHLKRVTTDIPPVEAVLTTGVDGRFSGVLPEGYFFAMVEAPGMAVKSVPIKLQADVDIDVSMSEGLSANGQVLWKGTPVTSLKLLIAGVNRELLLPTMVDDEGRFDVCLPQGSYEFRIGGIEHTWTPPEAPKQSAYVAGAETGTGEANNEPMVEAGEDNAPQKLSRVLAPWVRLIDVGNSIDGNIKLQDGCIVEFEVVDQNDHGIPDCIIDCRLYEAERDSIGSDDSVAQPPLEYTDPAPYGIVSRSLTDPTGRCRLILGAGIYTFDLIPSEVSQAEYKQIRQLSINGSLRRKIRLTVPGIAEIITMESASAATAAGIGVE
jgi:hypothetical protein